MDFLGAGRGIPFSLLNGKTEKSFFSVKNGRAQVQFPSHWRHCVSLRGRLGERLHQYFGVCMCYFHSLCLTLNPSCRPPPGVRPADFHLTSSPYPQSSTVLLLTANPGPSARKPLRLRKLFTQMLQECKAAYHPGAHVKTDMWFPTRSSQRKPQEMRTNSTKMKVLKFPQTQFDSVIQRLKEVL